jgi:hypothetical protein
MNKLLNDSGYVFKEEIVTKLQSGGKGYIITDFNER